MRSATGAWSGAEVEIPQRAVGGAEQVRLALAIDERAGHRLGPQRLPLIGVALIERPQLEAVGERGGEGSTRPLQHREAQAVLGAGKAEFGLRDHLGGAGDAHAGHRLLAERGVELERLERGEAGLRFEAELAGLFAAGEPLRLGDHQVAALVVGLEAGAEGLAADAALGDQLRLERVGDRLLRLAVGLQPQRGALGVGHLCAQPVAAVGREGVELIGRLLRRLQLLGRSLERVAQARVELGAGERRLAVDVVLVRAAPAIGFGTLVGGLLVGFGLGVRRLLGRVGREARAKRRRLLRLQLGEVLQIFGRRGGELGDRLLVRGECLFGRGAAGVQLAFDRLHQLGALLLQLHRREVGANLGDQRVPGVALVTGQGLVGAVQRLGHLVDDLAVVVAADHAAGVRQVLKRVVDVVSGPRETCRQHHANTQDFSTHSCPPKVSDTFLGPGVQNRDLSTMF
ncbi:MAG: hypothetical protein QM723_37195 [Myxococcaceae bacterium]